MSIRIHELAKKISMDNKQLLALLKERKYDVKSVSSTIDNISAEAIEQEFGGQDKSVATATEPSPESISAAPFSGPESSSSGSSAPKSPVAPEHPQNFTTKSPTGVMVRTAQDVAREKEEQAKAARPPAPVMASAPRPVAPPPPPSRSAQSNPPMTPPPVVNRPAPVS